MLRDGNGPRTNSFRSTSFLVEKGDHPQKAEKLALVKALPLLPVTSEVIEIAEVYIERFVMSRNDPSDPATRLPTQQ